MSGTLTTQIPQAMSPSESRLAHRASRHIKEKIIESVLFLAAMVSVFTTLGIVYILVSESVVFFSHVPLPDKAYATNLDHLKKGKLGTAFGGVAEVGITIDELMKREAKL